jgi:hypothetical protein
VINNIEIPRTYHDVVSKLNLIRDFYCEKNIFRPCRMIYSKKAFDGVKGVPVGYRAALMETARDKKMELIELMDMPFIQMEKFGSLRGDDKLPIGFTGDGWLGRNAYANFQVYDLALASENFRIKK